MTPAAASLVEYACAAGLVERAEDLDLVERLAVEVEARREAYRDGQASIKGASLDVCRAADWSRVASDLDTVRRARAYRARMLDARSRPYDYAGRRGA